MDHQDVSGIVLTVAMNNIPSLTQADWYQQENLSYLPFLCKPLALEIQLLFSIEHEDKASNDFWRWTKLSIMTTIIVSSLCVTYRQLINSALNMLKAKYFVTK